MENKVVESSVQVKDKKYWNSTILRLAAQYDIIPSWWSPSRDAFFRGYWYQENFLASAIYAIANRNAAFGWELTGLDDDVKNAQQLLQFAEFGEGWQSFIIKTSIDLLSQDNGAFVEVIRPARVKIDGKTLPAVKEYYENDKSSWYAFDGNRRIELKSDYNIYDSPLDLPIGIAHLDSGQCVRTGDPDTPVIYTDRNGKKHALKWWQVLTFNEMPSPIEKMNGVGYCLHRDSSVLMENGTYRRIVDLFNERSLERVMSIDNEGKLVAKEITRFYKNKINGRSLVNIRCKYGQITRGSKSKNSWVTEDHPILTPNGYVNAGELNTGDLVVTSNLFPNEKQIQFIIGTVLGDASISRKSNKTNSRISVGHCKHNGDWIDIKSRVLSFLNINHREQTIKGNMNGYSWETEMAYIETGVSPALNWLRESFYKPNKKIPLELLKKYVSPILMCSWYLDDGHIQNREPNDRNRNPVAIITTTGFDNQDVIDATKIISEYGYECNVYNDGDKYSIRFTTDGSKKLFEDISTYVPESMRYKIPHNSKEYNENNWDICYPNLFVDEIIIDKTNTKQKSGYVYCIDVKDTHNFITAGMVVHNCAVSRLFRASHIMQSIALYNDEKVSGRFNRAVFLTNVDPETINDAIVMAQNDADNAGLIRYSQPIVAATLDPSAAVSLETINLAEIPDGFDYDRLQNWYIANLALALGVDYGFLAPLPGKGLGSASQSETMERQSRGKSSRLFMDMMSNAINFKGILPESVQFNFIETDADEEAKIEKSRLDRANRYKVYGEMGWITPTVAQQMLSDEGDIPEVYVEQMGQEDTTPVTTTEGDENVEAIEEQTEGIEESEQVKERQKQLFKRPSLVKRIKNVASKIFKKKQVEVPSVDNPDLQDALDNYSEELETLALRANNGEITKDEFINQLSNMVTLSLMAIYSEMIGKDPDEFTDEDQDRVDEYVGVNLESVDKLADDIYDDRYQDTEDRDGVLMLLTRLGLWTMNAYALATLGQVVNDANREKRYKFIIGPTSDHCSSCLRLNGQVHTGSEWAAHPDSLPRNHSLECRGFNCMCSLVETNDPVSGSF